MPRQTSNSVSIFCATASRSVMHLILCFLFGLTLPLSAIADTTTEGWTWTIGCPGDGTTATSTFAATSADGSGFTSSGNCARTSTHFTQFSFTTSSGGTTNSSTLYGLQTGDWLVIPPVLTTESMPVYTTATACPVSSPTLNWIFVQWDNTTPTMSNTYVLGTASYTVAGGVVVDTQYSVIGAAYWIGQYNLGGTCSNGVAQISGNGSADTNGNIYFTSDGSGVFKTSQGQATFFFPQYSIGGSGDLGNMTFQGITFDSHSGSDTRNVTVSSDSTGSYFTVQLYSNPGVSTSLDNTYTDTISITGTNSPQLGMMLGTVTRTGTGAGTSNIACIVNVSLDTRVICTGPSPANSSYPYTVTFVNEGLHVFGQADTSRTGSGVTASNLNDPVGATTDGTRLYVSEWNNNRVLIWNTTHTTNGAAANIVLGQANFTSNTCSGSTSATNACPWNTVSDGTRVIVSDNANSRILIWKAIPTSFTSGTSIPADIVLAQPDMTSGNSGTSATQMNYPSGVTTDGTRIFIADQWNHRVLIWNSIPTSFTSGTTIAPNIVLGQSNWTASAHSSTNLSFPMGIATDGTRILVHDSGHNRVLIWNAIPTSFTSGTGIYANIVLGQAHMTSTGNGTSSTAMHSNVFLVEDVSGVDVYGGKIYVSDMANNRILIWNTIPTSFTDGTAIPANIVLGQPNFTASSSGATSQGLNYPDQVSSDGTRLFITDSNNNRILFWPAPK